MKVLLAGGGTAGHVNPAISIAQCIRQKRPEAEILFVGKKDGIEQKLVTQAGFDIKYIDIDGINRKNVFKNIKTAVKVFNSTAESKEIIKDFAPDIVIGTGGYVSFPVLYSACKMGISTAIHEQNAFPGVTSKLLARHVDRIMLGFESGRKYFPKNARIDFVGNPIREGFVFADRKAARLKLCIPDGTKYIVSFGGSMGARELNKVMAGFIKLHAPGAQYMHTHAAGSRGYQWMPDLLASYGIEENKYPLIDLREYIDNMQDVMAAADLIICRAGAITLAEVTALGKPSILIPSPNVTNNHQFYNAKSLADSGAAVLIEEKDVTAELIAEKAEEILSSEDKYSAYSKNASDMAVPDSADKIYSVIRELTV